MKAKTDRILFHIIRIAGDVGLFVWACFIVFRLQGERVGFVEELLLVVGAAAGVLLGTAIHELGHLVFGLIGGMKFKSVSFLFFKIFEYNGKLKFRFERQRSLFGVCEMYPTGSTNVVKGYALLSAGGPIGSLLALAVSVTVLALHRFVGIRAAIFFLPIAPFCYDMFIQNAWPSLVGGMKTDGAQLLAIIKKTPSAQAMLAVLDMQAGYARGVTPSELPWRELYDLPQLRADDPNYLYLLNARYLYALDAGNFDELKDAHIRIAALLDDMPEIFAAQLRCDLFYDSLFLIPDPAFIAENESKALAYLGVNYDVTACRILAAYYCYKGDITAAFREISRGRDLARYSPFGGLAKMELRLFTELEDRIANGGV